MNLKSLVSSEVWVALGAVLTALCCHESAALAGFPQETKTSPAELAACGSAGRLHPGYTVFAAQLSLPRITALKERTLDIGGLTQIEFSGANPRLATSPLADQLQIPLSALNRVLQTLSTDAHLTGKQLADSFRNALIDYKFLRDRWNRYHPPPSGLDVKTQALDALNAGDIVRAWTLYNALPRPSPPAGFQVQTH